MWLYLLVLLLPPAISFQAPRTGLRLVGLAGFYVFLWVFTGLRLEIGPDWNGYTYIFEGAQAKGWSAIASDLEPGFFLANKVADAFGWGLPGVNLKIASSPLGFILLASGVGVRCLACSMKRSPHEPRSHLRRLLSQEPHLRGLAGHGAGANLK